MPDLQEIVPGLETKAEESATARQRVIELKAPAIPSRALDTGAACHLLGRPVPASVFRWFWLLQLFFCCLEEPIYKLRAPGRVGRRCFGEREKVGVSCVRNSNPTFSRPLCIFVSSGGWAQVCFLLSASLQGFYFENLLHSFCQWLVGKTRPSWYKGTGGRNWDLYYLKNNNTLLSFSHCPAY